MKRLAIFFETERGKRIKNIIIGVGASVVLLGALFKLQHWPYAGELLIIGMCTEAFIFALLGILPPHKDYYWEKIYPSLDISPEEEEAHGGHAKKPKSVTQQLDSMLEEAHIESDMIKRLGESMNRLGDNISKLSQISDASVITDDYSAKAKEAASALAQMKVAYASATQAVTELAQAGSGTKEYHEQVQRISSNLASLNSMYELELQDTNNHLKAMNKFYGSMVDAMNNMHETVEDARKYKEELATLNKNLTSLNSVYGNMLSAMTIKS
jgi:gliding motility-associated protein GldL